MDLWLHTVLCLGLAAGPPTPAGPDAPPPDPDTAPANDGAGPGSSTIADAEAAWGEDRYAEVRDLLEPIAESDPLKERVEREKVLTLLADATLADDTLPVTERQMRATKHLERLMQADADWRLPRKVFSPELYELYLDLREAQIDASQNACRAGLLACKADADNVQAQLRRQEHDAAELQLKYDNQDVAIGEKRSRALAIFPLGISHFLNGDPGLGGAFLGVEAAAGIAGLTLLAYRAYGDGCRRTARFQTGSLQCDPRGSTTEEAVVTRRRAEESMAWVFLIVAVIDIAVAQYRFKAFEIVEIKSRKEVEDEAAGKGPKRRSRRRRKPRAKVRPSSPRIRAGGGVGLNVTF